MNVTDKMLLSGDYITDYDGRLDPAEGKIIDAGEFIYEQLQ
jgi:hypothetical protein